MPGGLDSFDYKKMQLVDRINSVAEAMRSCAKIAEEFAKDIDGIPSSIAQVNGKRKAEVLDSDDGEEEVDTGKKGKRKKAPKKAKDPNAPKRPPSSYLLFQNEVRNELKQSFPDLANSELLKMISVRWAGMSDADKQKYNAETANAKSAYNAKKALYDASGGAAAFDAAQEHAPAAPPKKRAKAAAAATPTVKKPIPAAIAPIVAATSSSDDDSEDSETGSTSEEEDSEESEEEEEKVPPPSKKSKKAPTPAPPAKEKKEKKIKS